MADPTSPANGGDDTSTPVPPVPGERRLARPPSDRYRDAAADRAPEPGPAASSARALLLAAAAALVGAVAITVLGAVLTLTAGLVVIAAATGWTVGTFLPGRTRAALALALVAIALGQLGLWVYARSEGGVLGPLDLLWQVYGGLLPLEFLAAAGSAGIAAR